jgi:hypothetical protein
VTTQTASGLISADTPDANTLRVFPALKTFPLDFTTSPGTADTVIWSMQDQLGKVRGSGSFAVAAGTHTSELSCASSYSGYLALTATLQHAGGTLPQQGTQPPGVQSIGILPQQLVPVVTYAHADQHRFGMQGFNSNAPGLAVVGATDVIDDREQSWGEPSGPNTYTPSASDLDPFFVAHPGISRIVRLDGIPAWNSSSGLFNDSYSLPKNLTEYGQYMAKVGMDTKLIHSVNYPNQQNDYYQVTWEPSLGWPQTQGANFVLLYKTVYNALHSADPRAVVMGPTEPFANNNDTASGNRITSSPGLCAYIDGVTTHGYYNAPTVPSNPPELQDGMDAADAANALDNEVHDLRATMQACKPNMKLFNTELGISYDSGVSYPNISANQLYAQAAVAVRSHIIILGEGAQRTYFFFGPDFPDSLAGYGSFFDLQDSQGAYGATDLAPKPEAMGFAALSRVLDGTATLGKLKLSCVVASGCVHGYAFQQLNAGKVITALWWHKNANWPVNGTYSATASSSYTLTIDNAGASGNVTVIDMMGNASTVAYTNGKVTLSLTESPIYVVSSNATVMKANVTAPLGYVGQ